jgi:hypothetical protein
VPPRWPPGAKEVLSRLDQHRPQSRAVLITLAGIADEDWLGAVRFLVEQGLAIRIGSKRGTAYLASIGQEVPVPTRSQAPATAPPVASAVASGYHDLVLSALAELDGGCMVAEPGAAGTALWSWKRDEHDRREADRGGAARGAWPAHEEDEEAQGDVEEQEYEEKDDEEDDDASGQTEVDLEDEETDEVDRLEARLRALCTVRVIDHRARQGCLWVVDGPGVERAIQAVATEFGVRFYYKPDGGRATGGLPAWWTKGG